jgi:hypothetical protein
MPSMHPLQVLGTPQATLQPRKDVLITNAEHVRYYHTAHSSAARQAICTIIKAFKIASARA